MGEHRHLPSRYDRIQELLPRRARVHLLLPLVAETEPRLAPAITAWMERAGSKGAPPATWRQRLFEVFLQDLDPHVGDGLIRQARRDFRDLLRSPDQERRLQKMRASTGRFGSPFLVALLLDHARGQLPEDPGSADAMAKLAQLASGRTDRRGRDVLDGKLLSSCLPLATAIRGNVARVAGEIARAAELFAAARYGLQVQHPAWVQGEVLSLHGSLLKDQRRLDEAERCLGLACRHFAVAGDPSAMARAQLNLAAVQRYLGAARKAIRLTIEALAELDPYSEPHLFVGASHNLAVYLNDAGEPGVAGDLLEMLTPLYERFPDCVPPPRRRWLQGLIAKQQGRAGEAEGLLLDVVQAFTSQALVFDAAMAALDLALLLHEEGRNEELVQLVARLRSIFERHQVHREAMAAVVLFHKSCTDAEVTLLLIQAFREFVELARNGVAARFELPRD